MTKTSNPIVSIIVPVYNVDRYIDKCIKSITGQSISDIEIIAINDGSADNSHDALVKLAKKDSRIVVIDQKNLGVSVARNAGLNIARGKYIIFVDGDDWIAGDCVEYMLKLVKETKTLMAISTNSFTTRDAQQVTDDRIDIWTGSKAVTKFLYPGIAIGAWNKIYDRDFLKKNGLKFQEDMFMGEGMRFITDAAQRAKHVGVGRRKVYWYRLNNVSSVTTTPTLRHGLGALDAIKSIENNLLLENKQILRAIRFHTWMNNFYLLRILTGNKSLKSQHLGLYNNCVRNLQTGGLQITLESDVAPTLKLKMLAIILSPKTMARIINAYKTHGVAHDRVA